MYSLVIDTSYANGVVALFFENLLVGEIVLKADGRNSSVLAQEVQNLLDSSGVSAKEIKEVIVGIGPGSYTGIRVAVSFASGFAAPLSIPTIPVCSLAGFLSAEDATAAAVVADAKMGGVYYFFTDEEQKKQVQLFSLEAFKQMSIQVAEISVVGSEAFFQGLKPFLKAQIRVSFKQIPSSLQLFQYADKEKSVMPPSPLKLLYLRASQAEIERNLSR